MNCEAISAVLRSSVLAKSYKSSEERLISFERTKTNHDKLPRENNSLIKTRQFTLHIICINFQVVLFENNFREFGTTNQRLASSGGVEQRETAAGCRGKPSADW